ncbi:MAG: plasmid partitioning protein RepB C-terminal domain-containing protein [Planctomycetota bacterium]
MPRKRRSKVERSFLDEVITLPLDLIAPLKIVEPALRQTAKYRQIRASIDAVGVIEPLVVCRESPRARTYCLVDGHLRYDILLQMNRIETRCLVTTDPDTFTYNHKIQHVQPIQQHRMITRAIRNGVPEEEIAKALDIDVSRVRLKSRLLDGICPEAVKLLEGHNVPARTIQIMRQAKPIRQIEMADLMIFMNKYNSTYAQFLISTTPSDQLVSPRRPNGRQINGNDLAKIELEMQRLNRDLKSLEGTYAENMLHLVVIARYIEALQDNGRVRKYLAKHYGNYSIEFDRIIDMPEISQSDLNPVSDQAAG